MLCIACDGDAYLISIRVDAWMLLFIIHKLDLNSILLDTILGTISRFRRRKKDLKSQILHVSWSLVNTTIAPIVARVLCFIATLGSAISTGQSNATRSWGLYTNKTSVRHYN